MPMFYSLSLATPGNSSTNGSANTETDMFFIKPGVRTVELVRMDIQGMASALSTMTGIQIRLISLSTASTAGTTITPAPPDPGMQAAKATSSSLPTIGTTRKNHKVFGCTATGPGAWYPVNPDEQLVAEGGAAGSIDALSVSGGTSMAFGWSAGMLE